MPATYTVRINGVDKADTNVLLEGFRINEITNGINTLSCEIESSDASYRPVKRQTVEVEEDDGTSPVRLIFGGVIRSVRERGFGMTADGDNQILMAILADSYETLASRRFVTATFASQSLRTTFTSIVTTYLAAYGVTVDPGMAAGPTLEALDFKVVRVDDVFNFLATQSAKYGAPFTWKIGYDKVAIMEQTGTVAAPWNVLESDFTTTESTFGDIEVEPTDENYANRIIVVWGSGNVIDLGPDGLNTPEQFVGDGVTNSFPLKYQLLGPVPPPPLTSPPTASAIGYAYVNVPGGLIEFLGNTGTFGAEWEYDQVTNSISRVAGPPPLGYAFSVPYRGLATGEVTAENASEIAANGIWEDKILAPEIETPELAQAVADAELARRVNTGRIVRFRTRRMPAPQPGETITITVPKRAITGSFTVTDVATENDPGNANTLYRTVTCNSSIHEQSHQTLTRWWSEKDHAGIATPAGASALPDWPLNSVQFNDNWSFGGARHVLYGDLFWDQPDAFLGEVKNQGLIFNAGSAPYIATSPDGGSPYLQPGGWGDAGHIGLDDPFRLEMGMLGSGDFSMDLFAPSDETVSPPTRYQSSILINSVGDISLTASTPVVDGYSGSINLIGHGLPYGGPFADPPTNPVGVGISGGDVGQGYISLEGLTVFEGLAGAYRTVNSLPFSIQVTGNETDQERTTYVVTAGTGTIFLPWIGSAGTPNQRSFPNTSVGRLYGIVNDGGGTLTVNASIAGTNINDATSITLADKAAIIVERHDDGWRILASFGTVTGGGAATATPGGSDKDVQFNDGGVFGGESAFEYDKNQDQLALTRTAASTQIRLATNTGDGGLIGLLTSDTTAAVQFGWETVAGVQMARTYAPATINFANGGGSGGSPSSDLVNIEINLDEDPGSPMAFDKGRGWSLDSEGVSYLYQWGGLGAGNPGMGVRVSSNTSGSGAPAWLGLENQDGTPYYEWSDEDGFPHWGDFPPSEGTSPSPADSNFMTTGNVAEIHAIVKRNDESINNDTIQDDDELFFDVAANTFYIVELVLFATSGASNTPDLKTGWTLPSGATVTITQLMYDSGATAPTTVSIGHRYQNTSPSTAQPAGVLTSATQPASSVTQRALIRVGSTAGTAQFQWAQNTSTGGTPTVVKADSFLIYYRVPAG